jgi:hypothetical protein
MASIVRFSALAAFASAVSGYAIGEFPTQTVGYGSPFMPEPTEAPSMELVKKNLGKRALINTCTEWTIRGGSSILGSLSQGYTDKMRRIWSTRVF